VDFETFSAFYDAQSTSVSNLDPFVLYAQLCCLQFGNFIVGFYRRHIPTHTI